MIKPTTLNIQLKNKNAVLREIELDISDLEIIKSALITFATCTNNAISDLEKTKLIFLSSEATSLLYKSQDLYAKLNSWKLQTKIC